MVYYTESMFFFSGFSSWFTTFNHQKSPFLGDSSHTTSSIKLKGTTKKPFRWIVQGAVAEDTVARPVVGRTAAWPWWFVRFGECP